MRRDADNHWKEGECEALNRDAKVENVSRKKTERRAVQTEISDEDKVDLIVKEMRTCSLMKLKRVQIELQKLTF